MHPGTRAMRPLDQRDERIAGAGVDVAGLQAKDRGAGDCRQCVWPHATLPIDGHPHDARAADSQHAKRLQQRRMRFLPGDHADLGRAKQTVGLDIPTLARKHCMAGCGQRGEIRDRRSGDEAGGSARRQIEHLAQPAQCDALQASHARGNAAVGAVLVPGPGEPVRRQCHRQRATDHETEKPRSGHRHRSGSDDPVELRERVLRIGALRRQGLIQLFQRRHRSVTRRHGAMAQRLQIGRGVLGCCPQQSPGG